MSARGLPGWGVPPSPPMGRCPRAGLRKTERYASGAANGRSDVGAEAIGGRLQALVRQGPSLYLSLPPLVPHAY